MAKKDNISKKEFLEILDEYEKSENKKMKTKEIGFKKDFGEFLDTNNKIAISFLPILLLLNYLSKIEYGLADSFAWEFLVMILIIIIITYSINNILKLKNVLFLSLSFFIFVGIALSITYVGWDISKNNLCIQSESNKNSQIHKDCQKLKGDWINNQIILK